MEFVIIEVIGRLFWLIVRNISGILFILSLVLGIGYTFITSFRIFLCFTQEHINPYTTYIDKEAGAGVAKRSYFFGPGYHQVAVIIRSTFRGLVDHIVELKEFKNINLDNGWYMNLWVRSFYYAAILSDFLFGFAWMAIFSILLSSVIGVGMCTFYIFFTLLWIADRMTLAIKSIQNRCDKCKKLSIVPIFTCPNCGLSHRELTPGVYGILKRTCACGQELPTTFFGGRSSLDALCPHCETAFAVSDARQFGIQLVGGVSSGKTSFLVAFWHGYLERLSGLNDLQYKTSPVDAFAELEAWYQQGLSSATTEWNANVYSVIHECIGENKYQLTLYDIAGEAFIELNSEYRQLQFTYCEGIIFVIDPTVASNEADGTVSNFINEYNGLQGRHSTKMSNIPVAVVISKADLFECEIGLTQIKLESELNTNADAGVNAQSSMAITRNGMCRQFLDAHHLGNVVNLIEGAFNHVQYFSVSAMGHAANYGQPYEPWGVLEPVMWMLGRKDGWFKETVLK